MNLNSKDITGALFCCAFLILGLNFLEPGLSCSTYPPLTEVEAEIQVAEPINVDLGLNAAGAASPSAASLKTTYNQNSDDEGESSAIALARPETVSKDIPISSKAPVKTDPNKSTSPASKSVVNKSNPASAGRSKTQLQPVQGSRIGELISWSKASQIFALYDRAMITDVNSGLSFWVQRRGGSKHADCQPLTAADTAIMKKIYGGQWSWERKAIVVTVDGRHLAASMNGMPHAAGAIKNNNFDGHFCIHFLDSRTHGTNQLDTAHQSMVRKAAGK